MSPKTASVHVSRILARLAICVRSGVRRVLKGAHLDAAT